MLAAFLPGRWAWGLDMGRDLAPWSWWLPLALTLLAFAPPVATAFVRIVPRGERGTAAFAVALALTLALFSWNHPDRALYTGDTSLRHGAFATLADPTPFAEQALRGDLALHHALPRWVAAHTPFRTEDAGRAQGALLAFVTALTGYALARTLGARGAVAIAVMAVAASSAALALDNGYGKATVELAWLTTLIAVGVARAARDGGGVWSTGLAVAAALLLHRSAIALLPAWLACVALALRSRAWHGARAATGLALGVAAPLAALAFVLPQLTRVLTGFDTAKHLHGGAVAAMAFAFTPAHMWDVLQMLCLLAPLSPILPLLVALAPRARTREALAWGALVLPLIALALLVQPQHGLPRDWDVFAFTGSALAALTAWRVRTALTDPRASAVLALPVALVALVPALHWAALQSDAERTWSRAESVLMGPPARDLNERGDSFALIGMMRFGRGQYEPARALFERAAQAAPNPSTFVRIGMAETMLGRHAQALAQYRHAAELDSNLVTAWRGVAAASSALGDREHMAQAVHALGRLEPQGQTVRDARAWLEGGSAAR
ncbi:MAG: hypothetical protein ABL977_09705 [Candidatus Eisenbacteria bacterium]